MTENFSFSTLTQPMLHLIYASRTLPNAKVDALQEIKLDWAQQDADSFLGTAAFGEHQLHFAGLGMPLPRDVIDQTVMVSPWPGQIKAAMRQHLAHISLVYKEGSHDPIEQMIALYSLASAFENEDLLGIVNPNAWTAHPAADFLTPERIAQYRQEIPFNLWFGYVRFYTDDESFWLATKGHHIFDIPDLAYYVQPGEDPDAIINLFINIFYYLYEQDVFVTAGDTLEVSGSGQKLIFSEVTELSEVLMGPSGTLVLEKVNRPN